VHRASKRCSNGHMRRSGAHSRSRSQVLQKRDTVVPTCIPSQAPIDRSLAVTAFKPHAIRHTHTARAPYLSRSAPSSHSPHPLHYTPTPKPHSLLHSKSSNFKFPRSYARKFRAFLLPAGSIHAHYLNILPVDRSDSTLPCFSQERGRSWRAT
jgi:hypothetical protein